VASSSQVDATVPADGVKADKALIRANFLTAKTELTRALRYGRLHYSFAYNKGAIFPGGGF
jgi:hypothetical protein